MKVNQIEGTSAQSKWHFLPHSSALRAIAVGMLGVKVASGCGSLKKTKKKKERKKSKNANLLAFNLKEKQKQTKTRTERKSGGLQRRELPAFAWPTAQKPGTQKAPEHRNIGTL